MNGPGPAPCRALGTECRVAGGVELVLQCTRLELHLRNNQHALLATGCIMYSISLVI